MTSAPAAVAPLLFSEAFWRDPWALYTELRSGGPVHPIPRGGFVVIGADAVDAAFSNAQLTSEQPFRASRHAFGGGTLLDIEGPRHAELRRAIARPFARSQIEKQRSCIVRPCVERAIADIGARGGGELVADIAVRVSFEVVRELLGLPSHDDSRWLAARVGELGKLIDDPQQPVQPVVDARHELEAYIAELRATPNPLAEDAHLGHLLWPPKIDDPAAGLDDKARTRMLLLLFVAATATTTCGLSNLMARIARHPEWAERLAQDRALIPSFVSESMRIEPPLHLTSRFATEDIELHGVAIARGTAVELSMGAACHDPERYPDPELFDPARAAGPPPIFGSGVHACLGRSLGMAELECVAEVLTRELELVETGTPTPTGGKALRKPARIAVEARPRLRLASPS